MPFRLKEDSGFFLVNPKECGVEPIEKNVARPSMLKSNKDFYHFRLNATQLNNLNLSYLVRFSAENQYVIKDGFVKTRTISTAYKQLMRSNERTMVVFQAVSDVKASDKPNNLAYINEIIQCFRKKNPELNATLLIPLNQGRLGRRHSVLVEVIFEEIVTEITLHNAQKEKWFNLLYPHCLNDLKQTLQIKSIKYLHYGKQNDTISCGFFVHHYIKSILENKNANQLPHIVASLEAMHSNPTLLNDRLNENFLKQYPDARKITESGSILPWLKKDLEKALNKASYQKLNELNLDFDENTEETQETQDRKMTRLRR